MKLSRYLQSYVFCSALLLSAAGNAQIPVTDVASLKQQITEYLITVKQLKADVTQISKLDESIEQAFRQVQSIRGSRGMSVLANNEIYRKHRRELPFRNRYILDRLAQGELPADKKQLADGLLGLISIYQLHSQEVERDRKTILADNEKGRKRSTSASVLTNASAQLALTNTEKNINTYEGLIAQIEEADDIKATNDLLARISAENGLVLNQLLNLQATSIAGQTEREVAQDAKTRDVTPLGF